jgi:large subunit ribosomal protein L9
MLRSVFGGGSSHFDRSEEEMLVELILLERVENLGQMGQLVRVKPGFARNYLLPQKKALRATKENLAYFESRRAQLEATNLQRRSEATEIAGKLEGLRVVVIRQAGESGQLYGSVSARDIAEAVTQAGFTIEKRQVVLERPIKSLGMHPVRLVLHPEVSVTITANVAQSAEEADMQAKGIDPLRRREEEEEETALSEETPPAAAGSTPPARPRPEAGAR